MNIGFDAKRATSNVTGLGNHSRFVISNLIKYYPENVYRLFADKLPQKEYTDKILMDRNLYSLKRTRKPFWRTFGIVNDIKKEHIALYHGLSNELPFKINSTKVKSIVTVHDLIFLIYPDLYPVIDRIIYNIKAKYACRVADKIIAVSECTKRDIIKYYNVDPAKIEVVYQGCSSIFKEAADDIKKIEVKEKYHLPDKYLLSLGSIEKRKNILLIVKALKYIPEIHFIAIGKKRKYADKVLEYAEKNGLSDRVHLLSDIPLADLPAILQLSQIFIYPSRYEGFGIPIIEAINSGVPVLGATGSCLEEAGGPYTVYVDPEDEKELAVQVNRILVDDSLRKTMVEKGLEYVKRFSDEECTSALMEVYKKLV
jgi:glycosyltransferase involved in cell wall biosynthesis